MSALGVAHVYVHDNATFDRFCYIHRHLSLRRIVFMVFWILSKHQSYTRDALRWLQRPSEDIRNSVFCTCIHRSGMLLSQAGYYENATKMQ